MNELFRDSKEEKKEDRKSLQQEFEDINVHLAK